MTSLNRGIEIPLTLATDFIRTGSSKISSHQFAPLYLNMFLQRICYTDHDSVTLDPDESVSDDGTNKVRYTSFGVVDLYLHRPIAHADLNFTTSGVRTRGNASPRNGNLRTKRKARRRSSLTRTSKVGSLFRENGRISPVSPSADARCPASTILTVAAI